VSAARDLEPRSVEDIDRDITRLTGEDAELEKRREAAAQKLTVIEKNYQSAVEREAHSIEGAGQEARGAADQVSEAKRQLAGIDLLRSRIADRLRELYEDRAAAVASATHARRLAEAQELVRQGLEARQAAADAERRVKESLATRDRIFHMLKVEYEDVNGLRLAQPLVY
jgi:DNA repair exonuclease SbcCD ATPase subunit